MSKNILLPTDFSENALRAAIYAVTLYEKEPCTFHFLHASRLKASRMSNMSNKLTHVMAEKARQDLAKLKEKIETDYANKNHSFEVILTTNDLQASIEVLLEKTKIDLIIIGTKGESNAKEMLFGSNTVNVIKHVNQCPVMVIPNSYEYVKPEQIAFPTGFNRAYGDELLPLKQLIKVTNASVRVVHINGEDEISEAQKHNLALLKIALKNFDHSFHWMTNYDRVARAIQDFTIELDINILVMIKYKHGFIEDIIKEPIIKRIGFHPTIPFLVLPHN
ncbi:universal stress protein [Winogradskyella sp. F6397]|uniref:Universal stress protein n=1 Tax=Winogradskyella marina TaxID=2785530 RepID=A0ABS0EIU9_9FLAO|nr:universal stress protein [Winogradskyella marina]MBF8148586.1 universal stress protein [Winogradskyella marina]